MLLNWTIRIDPCFWNWIKFGIWSLQHNKIEQAIDKKPRLAWISSTLQSESWPTFFTMQSLHVLVSCCFFQIEHILIWCLITEIYHIFRVVRLSALFLFDFLKLHVVLPSWSKLTFTRSRSALKPIKYLAITWYYLGLAPKAINTIPAVHTVVQT